MSPGLKFKTRFSLHKLIDNQSQCQRFIKRRAGRTETFCARSPGVVKVEIWHMNILSVRAQRPVLAKLQGAASENLCSRFYTLNIEML
jgi:hypothetical protein